MQIKTEVIRLNDFDSLFRIVTEQAIELGIPVPCNISSHIVPNSRAVKRFGLCRKTGSVYVIELASRLAFAPRNACMTTIAHELLHTCPGCDNHGTQWKRYAALMNSAYGYNISRTSSCEALGIGDISKAKYTLVCKNCGSEIKRERMCPLVKHPQRYRCKCGGKLKLLKNQSELLENRG